MLALFCDGLCSPNPGFGTWAWLALDADGHEVAHGTGVQPDTTNNVMEHRAVLEALMWLQEHGHREATLATDSQLVVHQVAGRWACHAEHLVEMVALEHALVYLTRTWVYWVRRGDNTRADALTRIAYQAACGSAPRD